MGGGTEGRELGSEDMDARGRIRGPALGVGTGVATEVDRATAGSNEMDASKRMSVSLRSSWV
jgi:hypothetical protein